LLLCTLMRAATAVEVVRPGNALMAAAGVVVGAVATAGLAVEARAAAVGAGAVAAFFVAGAGNALNDYLDRAVDARAHPDRPIPSGRASPVAVLRFSGVLFALGLLAAAIAGPLPALVAAAAVAALLLYEYAWKARGLLGNVVVGVLTGLTFVMGMAAADAFGMVGLAMAALATLATIGREVLKDMEDAPHDEGRRTLPRTRGLRAAGRVAQAALVVGVLLSPLPLVAGGLVVGAYALFVGAADVGFLAAVAKVGDPARAQRLAKSSMVLALVGFLAHGVVAR
ncbi:MAG: UbiA family prenyltransferase, partial [Methanobacteriota archaeon]